MDLSQASTPVAFNAYAISSGHELVFCNQAAFGFLGLSPGHTRPHDIPGDDIVTEYRPIDADAVQAALWLTLYGFGNRYQGEIAIDGAYQRQLILRRRGSRSPGGQARRSPRPDHDRAHHPAPSAGLLQLLRREAA